MLTPDNQLVRSVKISTLFLSVLNTRVKKGTNRLFLYYTIN
jgi:hypothetical protein